MIGKRGWGLGTGIPGYSNENGSISGEKNIYNDMLIVVNNKGNINVFNQVNFEGSTATGWYRTKKLGDDRKPMRDLWGNIVYKTENLDGTNPAIADGTYPLSLWKHKRVGYNCLVLNYSDYVLTIGSNPNRIDGLHIANGIEIHIGGEWGWNYSEGCITVRQSDWSSFISCFPTDPMGTYIGTISIY